MIDQPRAESTERLRDHYRGFLGRLVKRGAHFPRAAFRHAVSFTSASRATTSTGMQPVSRRIVGTSWRESARGEVYSREDDRYPAADTRLCWDVRVLRGRHDIPASPADIAPPLAAILGLGMPPGPGARSLDEALARGPG